MKYLSMWINDGTFESSKERIKKQAHLLDSLENFGSRDEMTGELIAPDLESSLIDMLAKYCDHSPSMTKQNAEILAQRVFRMRRDDLGDGFDCSIENVSGVLKYLGTKTFPEMHMNMLDVAISKCVKEKYRSFMCVSFAMIFPGGNVEDPHLFATVMNSISTCLGHAFAENSKKSDQKGRKVLESFGSTLVVWMETFCRSSLNLGKLHPKKKEQIDRRVLHIPKHSHFIRVVGKRSSSLSLPTHTSHHIIYPWTIFLSFSPRHLGCCVLLSRFLFS
jgi:hypothetical protein